jgi:hypothetical protein
VHFSLDTGRSWSILGALGGADPLPSSKRRLPLGPPKFTNQVL